MKLFRFIAPQLFLFSSCLLPAGEPRLEKPFIHELKKPLPVVEKSFLRIATWDIEWFPAGKRNGAMVNSEFQIAAVASQIKDIKPDILLTQETRNLGALIWLNNNLGSNGFNFLASSWFGLENLDSLYHDKIQRQTGWLSRPAWKEIWEIDFSTLSSTEKPERGWLGARYEIGNLKFVVYNGWASDNEKDPAAGYVKRVAALKELKRDLERLGLDPYRDKILICGNFNSDFFAKEFEADPTFSELHNLGFNHSFENKERSEIITKPARAGEDTPDATFDYIWFSSGWGDPLPEAKVVAKGAGKRKDVYGGDDRGLASDHYPVYVDIPLESNP